MTFAGKISFPSKVPEFLHVLFNLVEKHSKGIFLGIKCSCSALLRDCARVDILSSFFSETKCKPAKKYRGNVFLLHRKAH